jgi:TolB protein
MSVEGETVTPASRVSFKHAYATSPRLSPDGKYLAYIARAGGFRLQLMDLRTGEVTAITQTNYDETLHLRCNGKFLLYATRVNGRQVLSCCVY